MYRINDKSAYIKRLQKMLGLPEVGRLDARTRAAIKGIQEANGLAPSGLPDYGTHLLILEKYREAEMKRRFSFIIRPYEVSELMPEINNSLSRLINLYGFAVRHPHGIVYGYDSIKAVKMLRRVYCIAENENIDFLLMDRITREVLSMDANSKSRLTDYTATDG